MLNVNSEYLKFTEQISLVNAEGPYKLTSLRLRVNTNPFFKDAHLIHISGF